MGRIGTTELILILALAVLLFGGSRLAGVGKALGKGIKEFKSEMKDDSVEQIKKEDSGEKSE